MLRSEGRSVRAGFCGQSLGPRRWNQCGQHRPSTGGSLTGTGTGTGATWPRRTRRPSRRTRPPTPRSHLCALKSDVVGTTGPGSSIRGTENSASCVRASRTTISVHPKLRSTCPIAATIFVRLRDVGSALERLVQPAGSGRPSRRETSVRSTASSCSRVRAPARLRLTHVFGPRPS